MVRIIDIDDESSEEEIGEHNSTPDFDKSNNKLAEELREEEDREINEA